MAPLSLVKPLGERVVKNEVIAAGGMFFDRNVVRSPVTGVLAIVSKSQGFVYIREDVEIGSQESPVEVHVAKMLGVPPWQIVIHKRRYWPGDFCNQRASSGLQNCRGFRLCSWRRHLWQDNGYIVYKGYDYDFTHI